jgi:hypothetical protein
LKGPTINKIENQEGTGRYGRKNVLKNVCKMLYFEKETNSWIISLIDFSTVGS